jgi:hypothetical protein
MKAAMDKNPGGAGLHSVVLTRRNIEASSYANAHQRNVLLVLVGETGNTRVSPTCRKVTANR